MSIAKRTIAIRTLGQLVQSTGLVVKPFTQHQGLLDIIISELEMGQGASSPPELRAEVMRTLGTIGAIDPYGYRGDSENALEPIDDSKLASPRSLSDSANDRGRNQGEDGRRRRRRSLHSSTGGRNNVGVNAVGGGSPSRTLMPKYHQMQLEDAM